MTVRPLTEALAETGLPDRTQLLLALMPGALFGFVPRNHKAISERVDCETCRAMMPIVQQCNADMTALSERVSSIVDPIRQRNKKRADDYERRKRWILIGWMFQKPKLKPEPDFKNEPWYREVIERVENLTAELKRMSDSDPKHWGEETARAESREVMSAFVAVRSGYVLTV